MADKLETARELAEKLQHIQEQLKQVEELLAGDPTDETLLGIKAQLKVAIEAGTSLYEQRRKEEEEAAAKAAAQKEAARAARAAAEAAAKAKAAAAAASTSNTAPVVAAPVVAAFTAGDRVEVQDADSGHWFPGIVEAANGDNTFAVKYFAVAGVAPRIDGRLMRLLTADRNSLPASQITVGLKIQARYTDEHWYPARVDEVSSDRCKVFFTKYNSSQVVPIEHIRKAAPPAEVKYDEQGNLIIPEHLKVQPTDTEHERDRKKRLIKSLKYKLDVEAKEAERSQKQQSWQQFAANIKKRPAGLAGLKKDSIFKSPEDLSGRVGVVGSGRGMTEFAQPKKLKTSHVPAQDGTQL